MPLIKYGQYLTYPDGNPVSEQPYPVMLAGGNVLVPVFTDKSGTPLANPVMTDTDGLLTFYAAPGHYVTDVSGTLFHHTVDETDPDDAWPGLFIHTQAVAATVWTVNHHFGVEPTVNTLVSGQSAEADVTHPTTEQTVITFGSPVSGTALLRR
jgi:hypothetical protein